MLYILNGDTARYIALEQFVEKYKNKGIKYVNSDEFDDFTMNFLQSSLFSALEVYIIKDLSSIDKTKWSNFLKKAEFDDDNKILCLLTEKIDKKLENIQPSKIINAKLTDKIKISYIKKYLNMDDNEAIKLFDYFSDNYYLLKNELHKLSLIFEDKKITFLDTKIYIFTDEQTKFFDITKNIFNLNFKDIDSKNFLMILSMLNKDLMALYYIHLFKLNVSYDRLNKIYTEELKSIIKINHPYPLYLKSEFLKYFTKDDIIYLLNKFHDLETGFKVGLYDNQIMVDLICLEIIKIRNRKKA